VATLTPHYESEGLIKRTSQAMKAKPLFALLLGLALAMPALAQDDSGIKQDTKDAAHSTGRAAKKTGHKVKKGARKVVHKGDRHTEHGAERVEDKTKPSPTPPPRR
jgi:hypothetical protein